MVMRMAHRSAARWPLISVLLLARFTLPCLASQPLLPWPEDFASVNLASNEPICLLQQTCFRQIRFDANKDFRLDDVRRLGSEFLSPLLRAGYNSESLLSLASFDDLQALWKHHVFY
jgi:hypothetical protein